MSLSANSPGAALLRDFGAVQERVPERFWGVVSGADPVFQHHIGVMRGLAPREVLAGSLGFGARGHDRNVSGDRWAWAHLVA